MSSSERRQGWAVQRAIQGVADGVAAAGLGALDAVGGIIRGRRSRSLGARVSIDPTVAVYPAEHGSDDPAIPPAHSESHHVLCHHPHR